MAWTETTRRHYRREALRYASDLTNAEWALISPFLPAAGKRGRPRKTGPRSVVESEIAGSAGGARPLRIVWNKSRLCGFMSCSGLLRKVAALFKVQNPPPCAPSQRRVSLFRRTFSVEPVALKSGPIPTQLFGLPL
ncbi:MULTISPECIES: transposase [unclassified Mesorhizobium]|uniref:transposase n=1 Tax=unclassified Mesorhizobium TaxID=325217 RepID=UPI0018DEB43A|nr:MULTISPECIES: transposase [unclassified Mesorhizobium]